MGSHSIEVPIAMNEEVSIMTTLVRMRHLPEMCIKHMRQGAQFNSYETNHHKT